MRRNKLYTVNQWNRNFFDWGGLAAADKAANPWNYADGLDTTQQYMQSKNAFGISKADNPFSKGNLSSAFSKEGIGNAMKGAAGSLITAGAGAVGSLAGNAISGGLESGAGNAIGSIGSTVGSAVGAVNPVLGAAVSVGSQLVGGFVNRAFGTKVDQAKLNAANEGTAAYNNFQSNATSFDDVTGPVAQANVQNAYSGGWFSSGKARRKNEELKRQRREARQFAFRSVDNNVNNLIDDQLNDALANYAAFGGPLGFGTGALGLMQQNRYFETLDNRSAALAGKQPVGGLQPQTFAFGGELGTNGTDWTNGLLWVSEGGTHEENPLEGVPMGFDPEGIPNLVEEGETIWNDYVFSDRLKVPKSLLQELGLPDVKKHSKGGSISFADASKKLSKESEQRPNDPISLAGLEASMSRLADIQEAERMKQQMKEYVGLSEFACGGKLGRKYDGTGDQSQKLRKPYDWDSFWNTLKSYNGSLRAGNISGNYAPDAQFNLGNFESIQDYENSPEYKDFTDRILESIRSLKGIGYKRIDKSKPGTIDNVILSNGKRPTEDQYNALKYVQRAAERTPDSANTGFFKDPDRNNGYYYFIDDAEDQVNRFRNDHKAGVYHLTPNYAAASEAIADEDFRNEYPMIARPTDEEPAGTNWTDGSFWSNLSAAAPAPVDPKKAAKPKVPKNTPKKYADWLRYAPAVGAGVMSLTDALGLTNKPDYTMADALQVAAQQASYAPNVTYNPIGDYLTYRPMDIWYEQNRMDANSRATDRAIMNSSSPSRMAGLLANGYNSQIASGNLYRQALEYNDAKREKVADFNRRTNMFNSQMGLEAAMANARYQQQAKQMGLSGLAQAAALRDSIDQRVGAARAANLSNFLNSLGDIGRENFAFNQINSDQSRRYKVNKSGQSYYEGTEAAYGGRIKKHK